MTVNAQRFWSLLTLYFVVALCAAVTAEAEPLPAPDELIARMGAEPAVVAIHEPHLTTAAGHVTVDYVGYPFKDVADALLGAGWETKADALEFRTLDGYVSRIPMTTFATYSPYLVFRIADKPQFTVDNLPQNEKDVPLGPYYLVWQNIDDKQVLAEGLGIWPYQIKEIRLDLGSDAALVPPGLDAQFKHGAELAKAYCLNCHEVNGYGGEKIVGNLAKMARNLSPEKFSAWLLDPKSVKAGTKMPALSPSLPEDERAKIASDLYAYLVNVPLKE